MVEFGEAIRELKEIIRDEFEKTILYRAMMATLEWLAKRLDNHKG